MIHIYYGYGKGKTCSAIGAGMRAYGAGKSVCLVQFYKNNKSNELKSVPFEVFEAPESLPFNPSVDDYKPWVDKAISYAENVKSDVVILDEFLDIIGKYISVDDAIKLFSDDKEYVITGHCYIEKLVNIADYVTNFQKEKHPYDKGVQARIGIEF